MTLQPAYAWLEAKLPTALAGLVATYANHANTIRRRLALDELQQLIAARPATRPQRGYPWYGHSHRIGDHIYVYGKTSVRRHHEHARMVERPTQRVDALVRPHLDEVMAHPEEWHGHRHTSRCVRVCAEWTG